MQRQEVGGHRPPNDPIQSHDPEHDVITATARQLPETLVIPDETIARCTQPCLPSSRDCMHYLVESGSAFPPSTVSIARRNISFVGPTIFSPLTRTVGVAFTSS